MTARPRYDFLKLILSAVVVLALGSWLMSERAACQREREKTSVDLAEWNRVRARLQSSPPTTLAEAELLLGTATMCAVDCCYFNAGDVVVIVHTETIGGEYRKASPVRAIECNRSGTVGPC